EEPFVPEKALDAVDDRPIVRVGLAEVVRSHGGLLERFATAEAATGPDVVHCGVVTLVQPAAQLLLDWLLAVHAVAAEALAETDHVHRARVGQEGGEARVASRHGAYPTTGPRTVASSSAAAPWRASRAALRRCAHGIRQDRSRRRSRRPKPC